jgi:K+-sensing histidine kinase KdpD/ActR/RegA family two-component response regulator
MMRLDPSRSRSLLLRYGFALLAVGFAVLLKRLVIPPIGSDAPFLLMLGPSLLAAWYGGLGPGIVAVVLSCVAVLYLFLAPYYDFHASPMATVHTIVFGVMSLAAVALMASVQASRRRAEVAARRIEGIYSVSIAIGGTRSIQEITDVILHEAVAACGASVVAIYLASEGGESLRLMTHLGRDPEYLPLVDLAKVKEVPFDAVGPVALAARTGAVVFVEDEDEFRARFPVRFEEAQGRHIPPAIVCAPMVVHGHVIGVFAIGFSRARRLGPEERSWAKALAQDCGMAVERARLFERERRARIDAQEAARTKDEFLAVVSKELRAPLTTIVGWAHMLKKRDASDQRTYRQGLDIIERCAQAQARLVEDILEMSRIVARKLRVDVKAIDLGPLVRACAEDVRVKAAGKGLQLEVDADVEAVVMGDRERFRQVLQKVLANALRFTPPGGHVRVELEVRDGRALVQVRDDGRGVASHELARLLEPFRSGKDRPERGERGLGLGLAIANYIVREHRGSLKVESPGPGRGTTTTIELPLAEPTAGMLALSDGSRKGDGVAKLTGIRVLVVDDDTDARQALAEMLAAEGADVRPAPPARVALEELKEFSPHVIVTDIEMPDQGHWFIREVRALPPPLATIPALALTNQSRPEDAERALAAGYQRQLPKPPEPRRLTEAIAQLGAPGACASTHCAR